MAKTRRLKTRSPRSSATQRVPMSKVVAVSRTPRTTTARRQPQPKGPSKLQPSFGKYSATSTTFPSVPGQLLKG